MKKNAKIVLRDFNLKLRRDNIMIAPQTLDKLKIGEKAVITKVKPELKNRSRYVSMGLIRDKAIEVLRIAPLGDPMIIKIMNYELSLRKNEASYIEIALNN